METSLHRQLKERYARPGDRMEVGVDGYRVDVVRGTRLVEIQHGRLGAIRDKVRTLLAVHRVTVVKPIIARKRLVKLARRDGPVVDVRLSPYRGSLLDLFDDLLHFVQVYPHRRLWLDVPLVDIEEHRCPRTRRARRRFRPNHTVLDQRLLTVRATVRLHSAGDLWALIDCELPDPFHTRHLADALSIDRWNARMIAYCLYHTGAVERVGKQGNAYLYHRHTQPRRETIRGIAKAQAALMLPLAEDESPARRAAG